MNPQEMRERVEYLTSLRLLTSDKYGIWKIDPIGIIIGFIALLSGVFISSLSGIWRLCFIIVGAFLIVICGIRIERRYNNFKEETLREIEKLK